MFFPALASPGAFRGRVNRPPYSAFLSHAAAWSVCLILVLATSATAFAGEWVGQEVTKEGVLHIQNPAEPMEPAVTLQLEEMWRLGGDTDSEDEFFGVIARVRTDEAGNIYLLDAQLNEVKIFSPDGEFVRSIGREGEGPGEFRGAGDMFIMGDGTVGVQQVAPGKIVLLTPDGEPAGDLPIPAVEGQGFRLMRGTRWLGDKLIMASSTNQFEEGKFQQNHVLDIVDKDGTVLKNLHTSSSKLDFANPVIEEKEWDGFFNRWDVTRDGRIMTVRDFGTYEIAVWNGEGKLDRVITREIKPRKRTDSEMDRLRRIFEAFIAQVPNGKAGIENTDSSVQAMWGREDGSIWVLSSWGSRDQKPGVLGTFDVFDKAGRFVRQVTLEGDGEPLIDGYFFDKDRLYVVTDFVLAAASAQGQSVEGEDDDAEPMEVICYKLDVSKVGI